MIHKSYSCFLVPFLIFFGLIQKIRGPSVPNFLALLELLLGLFRIHVYRSVR